MNKEELLKEVDHLTYKQRLARAVLLGKFDMPLRTLLFTPPLGKEHANDPKLQELIKDLRAVSVATCNHFSRQALTLPDIAASTTGGAQHGG